MRIIAASTGGVCLCVARHHFRRCELTDGTPGSNAVTSALPPATIDSPLYKWLSLIVDVVCRPLCLWR